MCFAEKEQVQGESRECTHLCGNLSDMNTRQSTSRAVEFSEETNDFMMGVNWIPVREKAIQEMGRSALLKADPECVLALS